VSVDAVAVGVDVSGDGDVNDEAVPSDSRKRFIVHVAVQDRDHERERREAAVLAAVQPARASEGEDDHAARFTSERA